MSKIISINSSKKEFDFYYYKYHKQVYRNIYKLVRDDYYARDILQNVFMKFWEKLSNLNPDEDIAGWLFVVSYNYSINFLKKKIRESSILLRSESISILEFEQEKNIDEKLYEKQLEILNSAVSHLPERKQEVFRKCKIEGEKIDKVAEQMGITVASAKNYLKQSNKQIRLYIQRNYRNELTAISILFWIINL